MPKRPSVPRLWRAYFAVLGEAPEATGKSFDHWHFGDNAADADELAALPRCGIKRATSPSLWELEVEGARLPQPADLHVVPDWNGAAQCVIRTTRAEVRFVQ